MNGNKIYRRQKTQRKKILTRIKCSAQTWLLWCERRLHHLNQSPENTREAWNSEKCKLAAIFLLGDLAQAQATSSDTTGKTQRVASWRKKLAEISYTEEPISFWTYLPKMLNSYFLYCPVLLLFVKSRIPPLKTCWEISGISHLITQWFLNGVSGIKMEIFSNLFALLPLNQTVLYYIINVFTYFCLVTF